MGYSCVSWVLLDDRQHTFNNLEPDFLFPQDYHPITIKPRPTLPLELHSPQPVGGTIAPT